MERQAEAPTCPSPSGRGVGVRERRIQCRLRRACASETSLVETIFVDLQVPVRKAAEDDLLQHRQRPHLRANRRDRDLRRQLNGVAIDTGADAGEGQRGHAIRCRDLYRTAVAGCKELRLTIVATTPDWTDCVDNELRRQAVGTREFCIPRLATAEKPAFIQQRRPRGTMNRTVDAATA